MSSTTQKGQHEPGAHSSRANQYRPEIDGLRAFAVIAVIANHMNPHILPSGYLGVDIFFVISGFVITASMLASSHTNLRLFLTNFYSRRARRLLPALLVFILITSLLICLVNPTPADTLLTGMSALFGGSNLYLMQRSADYFAPSTQLNAFTHTWSLGVEEQFYFLFPLLLGTAGLWRNNAPAHRRTQSRLGWIIFALSGLSLLGFLALYKSQTAAVYFLMPFRFWELGFGCILAIVNLRFIQIFKHVDHFHGPLSLLVFTALITTFFAPERLATQATVLAVVLTCMLIAFVAKGSFVYKLLTHRISLWIGTISYSLYLWHWSILSLSNWTVGIHAWTVPFQG
ncbi:MAG: acyltransferase [Pseudomonadota bacterium]